MMSDGHFKKTFHKAATTTTGMLKEIRDAGIQQGRRETARLLEEQWGKMRAVCPHLSSGTGYQGHETRCTHENVPPGFRCRRNICPLIHTGAERPLKEASDAE